MPTGSCLHLQRGTERRDLIWRVPRLLFPTLCMLHCQEGREWGMRGETYECGISGGPVLSTLHCFDCHDIMCLNTVNPPPPPLHPPCTHKDFPFSFLLQRCRASTEASLLLTLHIWLFIQFSFHPPPPPPCFGLPTFFTLITALL